MSSHAATWSQSPWLPRASCDSSCVRIDAEPALPASVVVAAHLRARGLRAGGAARRRRCSRCRCPARSRAQRVYCRMMLRCLGVRITTSGGPIRNLSGVLVVSGHVSWVDIFVIGAVLPGSFVARADLIEWPALGVLARLMKVIPIERASLRRLPDVVRTVADRLSQRANGGRVPRGDHVVRPRLRPLPARDVPGRHRRRSAGAAAAADLSPPRRAAVDDPRLHRRRLAAGVGQQGHHRPTAPCATCRCSHCSCPARIGATWRPDARRPCAAREVARCSEPARRMGPRWSREADPARPVSLTGHERRLP